MSLESNRDSLELSKLERLAEFVRLERIGIEIEPTPMQTIITTASIAEGMTSFTWRNGDDKWGGFWEEDEIMHPDLIK